MASCVSLSPVLAESWQPIQASASYVAKIREVWAHTVTNSEQPTSSVSLDSGSFTVVPARPVEDGSEEGPTAHSTGLGLPLSRALAKAGGGWLGLEDSSPAVITRRRAPSASRRVSDELSASQVARDEPDMTRYWCVMAAPPVVKDIVLAVASPLPGGVNTPGGPLMTHVVEVSSLSPGATSASARPGPLRPVGACPWQHLDELLN